MFTMGMERSSDSSVPCQSFYLLCLTLDGIPLFSRTEGPLPILPFPVIGSLNGIHMFVKNKSIELGMTNAENARIAWKEFANIKLIIVGFDEEISETFLNTMLEYAYYCMVMVVGESELKKITNVEKLKKKLRLCLPFVMRVLSNETQLVSSVTRMPDVIHCGDVSLLQNCLNSFTEDCQSEFSCLVMYSKVIVATEKFWQLCPFETLLLQYFHQSLPETTAVDVPIYLPNGSPTIPHRLVIANLIENVHVMIVCGPEPSLQDVVQKNVKKYWLPLAPVLRACLRSYPRGFTHDIKLDTNLVGFVLLNTTDGKCLSSLFPHGSMTASDQMNLSDFNYRKKVLLSFYKSVVSDVFVEKINKGLEDKNHDATETYSCTNFYKCYAMKTLNHQIFTLFTVDVPTYAMGTITKQTMKQLVKERFL